MFLLVINNNTMNYYVIEPAKVTRTDVNVMQAMMLCKMCGVIQNLTHQLCNCQDHIIQRSKTVKITSTLESGVILKSVNKCLKHILKMGDKMHSTIDGYTKN